MPEIADLLDKNHQKAHAAMKEMLVASAQSNQYDEKFEDFIRLLDHPSSYVRTRGFCLACAQARWDQDAKIEAALPRLLKLLHDPKPTVVRQCLAALHEVILFQPQLCPMIQAELERIDVSGYWDSMAPLILQDVKDLLEKME